MTRAPHTPERPAIRRAAPLLLTAFAALTLALPAQGEAREPQRQHPQGMPPATQLGSQPSAPIPAIDAAAQLRARAPARPLASGQAKTVAAPIAPPQLGDSRVFHVYDFSAGIYREVMTTLREVGTLSNIWVEDGQFGPDQVTQASLVALREALEEKTPAGSMDPSRGILPIEHEVFGQPPNADGGGRVHIVVSDIKDRWSEGCGCSYTAGFFDPVDQDPTNPASDVADILYVDAYPGIYSDDLPANPSRVLGTLAHEYQHLIHASYGRLSLFQNEGQSEWATMLTGYGARNMTVLSNPAALNVPLFSWGASGNVAYDYQRAGLFTAYLAGQAGTSAVGALTQTYGVGSGAYEDIEDALGRDFGALLQGFNAALWLNDASVSPTYAFPQAPLAKVGLPWPTRRYEDGGTTEDAARSLSFGGAEYLQWIGVSDMTLGLPEAEGMGYVLLKTPGDGGATEVQTTTGGSISLSGSWESVVLAPVNALATGDEITAPGSRGYSVSATYTPLGLSEQLLRHYDPTTLSYFVALPRSEDQTRQAVRLTPSVTGELREILLGLSQYLDGSPNPVGEGALLIHLATSVLDSGSGSDAIYVPGETLGTARIPFEDLSSGLNTVDVRAQGWTVTAGQDLQIVVEVEGEGTVYFDLDTGSEDPRHPDYYAARTRRWQISEGDWDLTWLNNGNIALAARVFGALESAPPAGAPRYPAASDIPLPVRLAYYPLLGAGSFDVQVAATTDFAAPLLDATGLTGTWTPAPDLDLGETYHWRVRGVNGAGPGPWSEPQTFTTREEAEGGESLSYINREEIYWAVTLPYFDESAWSLRFTPYSTGEITALTLDLSDLGGLTNPAGTGTLRISLHDDVVTSGEGTLDAVHVPGASSYAMDVDFADLVAGPNTLEIPGWPVALLEDQHIVLETVDVSAGGGLTFDLDNGSSEIVDVAYYPARTRRDLDGSGSFAGSWLNNGNIGMTVEIGGAPATPTPIPEPTLLSYYDPETLYWYASLPYNDETAWAQRLSPQMDGVLTDLRLRLTTWYDGSANPVGTGALKVELRESVLSYGEGSAALYVPGALLGSLRFPLGTLISGDNTVDIEQAGWALTAGEDVFLTLSVEGDGYLTLDLDDGSQDSGDARYYPVRTLRYWGSTSSWDQRWLNHGNIAIGATLAPLSDDPTPTPIPDPGPGPGCQGGEGRAASPLWGLLGLVLFVRRRRR